MVFSFLKADQASAPMLPHGRRVYAIGDVHGRLDLLVRLLARIREDDAGRGVADTVVVLLGDLIDRGPRSADVVGHAMAGIDWASLVCLKGNHEATMIDALDGDVAAARVWLRYGGAEALASWNVPEEVLERGDIVEIVTAARQQIPESQRAWLRDLPVSYRAGDFYFVHAGVRPGIRLDRQSTHDQLWIRDEFLGSRSDHGAVIVHGHSISQDTEDLPNRIGVDTGAYASGRLSAVGLEGADRWFLDTGMADPIPQ